MRKRKIGIIAFLSILNIPVSIVFSTIIHSKLSNIAISQIVVDKQILLLFFLIYMLIETTIIILFGFGSKNVFESGVLNITDKLKTPEIMGQGQHGTARWLSKKEFKKFIKKYKSKYKIKKNQYFEYEEHNLNEKCWQEGFITYDCKYEGNI